MTSDDSGWQWSAQDPGRHRRRTLHPFTMIRDKGSSSAGDITPNASASAAANANNNIHRQQRQQQESHSNSKDQQHEGKEKILPLTRRPLHHRLDVYPFIICYAILIWMDLHCSYSSSGSSTSTLANLQRRLPLLTDALYIILLISQLILFLKCQWDPIWYAAIAYRQYKFKRTSSSL